MYTKILRISFLLFLPILAFAQNGKLSGIITDKETKEALIGANIRVYSGGQMKGGTAANEKGEYVVSPLSPGTYDVEFSFSGYTKRVIKDVSVNFESTTRYNIALAPATTEVDEVTIETYKVPLIDKDNPSYTKLTSKDIEKLPTRDVNSVLSTTAGVYSSDDGGALNVRGNRGGDNIVFVNGVRQFGNSYPPVETIAEISIITGGVPAQYGDALGGIISVTTKGAAEKYKFNAQYETSRLFDKWQYDLAGINFSGPILRKTEIDPETAKETKRTLIGMYAALQFNHVRDASPSAYGYLVPKGDVKEDYEREPFTRLPDRTYAYKSEYFTQDQFNRQSWNPNSASNSVTLNTTIDFQPKENMLISVGGTYDYGKSNNFSGGSFNLFNSDLNVAATSHDANAFIRFRQSFKDRENASGGISLKNFYYQLQADYTKTFRFLRDERFKNRFELYNYVGKFKDRKQQVSFLPSNLGTDYFYLYAPNSNIIVDSINVSAPTGEAPNYLTKGSPMTQGFPGPIDFEPYADNLVQASGTRQIVGAPDFGLNGLSPLAEISSYGGTLNGQQTTRLPAYDPTFRAPGQQFLSLGYDDREQLRISAQLAGDIGRHTIKIGGEFEQRTVSQFGANISPWISARSLVNGHIISNANRGTTLSQFDKFTFQDGRQVTVISPDLVLQYDADGTVLGQTDYDKRLRKQLNIPINQLINIDELDPSLLALRNFTPTEILGDGQNFMSSYQGYNAYGKRTRGRVNYFDFFTDTINRPIDSWRPIYFGGFIEDKFEINDLIVRLGLRIDQFDVNQPVLRDRYSLTKLLTAKEAQLDKFSAGTYQRPSNIGDDYAVYINKSADGFIPTAGSSTGDESRNTVVGYRNGNQWYNANGQEVQDKRALGESNVFPLYNVQRLSGQDAQIQKQTGLTLDAFKDYKPTLNVSPRIAFSFPISEDAIFFAHYDILTQRPNAIIRNGRSGPDLFNGTGDNYVNPLYYYTLKRSGNNSYIPNPDLKPQKKIDYQLGFQQRLTQNTALKISAFYSEIKDLIQVVNVVGGYPNPSYQTNGNQDFGVVKGATFAYDYRKKGGTGFGANASYTLQFAEGSASDFAVALVNTNTPNLRNVTPQNWDQRHALKLNLDYRIDEGQGPQTGTSHPFENMGFNATFFAGSGLPYSKDASVGNQKTFIQGAVNGSRLPWNNRTGLRVDKMIYFKPTIPGGSESSLNVYLYVQNLFDQRNILGVYRRTGKPDQDGYLQSDFGKTVITSASTYSAESYAFYYNYQLMNPNNISVPRRIRIGVSYNF